MPQNNSFDRLYEAILNIETKDECRRFFEDICTIKEMIDISQRLDVAELLGEGKSYTDISKITGASTATICRVNRCYMYGNEGYKDIIKKLPPKENVLKDDGEDKQ